ncbi:PEP-CTERM sorting domain-containing protein [Roseateles oligotrophus]|uniref:PEP-CTERM sorting domain-containing protein n=1 Tax=Roseateles oligotrophus TaxID=1769250 RepID=A0ABT2YJK4_9BURK|nr:PEP-CTERM sorting domain-containing protein [Roseateles oligotrophus]MCV2370105.1 PEP-CTERM sorting domain-containing protein [Roseateles oligotrophus]
MIDFQNGNFFVAGSVIPDQTIAFVVDQNITINGITKSVAFSFSTQIGADDDHLFVIQASVNAVPEPASYAMLLAGLGLLGFATKRRQGV